MHLLAICSLVMNIIRYVRLDLLSFCLVEAIHDTFFFFFLLEYYSIYLNAFLFIKKLQKLQKYQNKNVEILNFLNQNIKIIKY